MTTSSPSGTSRTGAAPRLYERAADILAARIESGAMAPGERLLESHVAEQFGISRAPARQALARLARLGLVRRSRGHGYVVAQASRAAQRRAGAALAPIQLAQQRSWERIYREVEQEIAARMAFRSWRVLENHLADFYGVSRTVARDVLARLQQRGVVKKEEARWVAPELTRSYVAELYQMRWLLEPAALAAAAPRVSKPFVTTLRRHLEEANGRAAELSASDLSELETEMHVSLLAHCGNATLLEAISLYQSLLVAHIFLYEWTPDLYGNEPFLPEHLAVAEQLEADHVAAAAAALEDHLRLSLDRAVGRIEAVRRTSSPSPLPYLEPL
jgi:DNA-binding GntR family transcriptional regulator